MKFRTNLARSLLAASLMLPFVAMSQQNGLVPIITYDQEHPLANLTNVLPMVQVFSSGEVVVYRGQIMINPGRYEIQLSASDLSEITALAEAAGLSQLESGEVVRAAETNSLNSVVSDPTTSTFEFNRVSGQNVLSAGDGSTSDAMQIIEIEDVVHTASSLPGSTSANALKDLHVRLIQIFTQAGQ